MTDPQRERLPPEGGQPAVELSSPTWLQLLPYPWSARDGLTALLRDEALWTDAVGHPSLRKAIKQAAKDTLNVRGVPYTDLTQLSRLAMRLFARRRGRDALFAELGKAGENVVASQLQAATRRRTNRVLPTTVYRWQGKRYFLDPALFRVWITGPDAAEWTPSELVLTTAPFAIVSPREARALVAALTTHSNVEALLREEIQDSVEPPTPRVATESTIPTLDPRLSDLAHALRDAGEASQRARSALDIGQLARAGEELQRARDLSELAAGCYSVFVAREDVAVGAMPAAIPGSALADAAGADAWLRLLDEQLEATREHSRAVVHRHRDRLIAELMEVGLPAPSELEHAETAEDIEQVRRGHEGRIRLEQAWRRLVDGDTAGYWSLRPQDRRTLLSRCVEHQENPGLALALFVEDETVRPACELERLVPLALDHLVMDGTLPAQFWSCLYARTGDVFLKVLDAHDACELIASLPDDRLQASDLRAVLDRLARPFGHPLTTWYDLRRLRAIPAAERIGPVAELAASTGAPAWISLLVDSLTEAGRYADALVVGTVAARTPTAGRQDVTRLRRPMLHLLIDGCTRDDRAPIIRSLLANSAELATDIEGMIALAYAASVLDPEQIDPIVYRDPTLRDDAFASHPVLVKEWLLRVRSGLTSTDQIRAAERRHGQARRNYLEWTHDLEKKSTYSSWPPAADYQRHMADWLARKFDQLCTSRAREDYDDPDDIIEQLQVRHGLPPVQGGAHQNMISYLQTQLDRLDAFGAVLVEFGGGDLRRYLSESEPTLHERLVAESQAVSGPVAAVYAIAIREQAP